MDFTIFKNEIIKKATEKGIASYELYLESSEDTDVSAFGGEINEFTASLTGGASFRCIVNGKMGQAYTQDLTEASAKSVVEHAYQNALVLENEEEVFFGEGGKTYESFEPSRMPVAGAEELVKVSLAGLEALKGAHEKVTETCSAGAGSAMRTIALMNSNGVDLELQNSMDYVLLSAVVSDGNEDNDDYIMRVLEPSKADLPALAKEVAGNAAAMLGASPAPTQVCPVVFSPEAMCSMLSVFSSSFSSERAQKDLSILKDREGEMIASPLVTILDDPFYEKNPMRINFDAEGSPAHKKAVISEGKLETLLYNLKTAHVKGVETTGNASRMNYEDSVGIAPFTMVLQPGEFSEEELLQKAGNGVYISDVGGLHAGADQITGDFSLMSSGFMIEDGKKTTPVKNFTVAGNFFDLLKTVAAIGDNVKLPHPGRATAFASPSVLVEKLSVSGK